MSYTALDYYFAKMPVPGQKFRPANGTILHSYLYNREVVSITSNLDKWAEVGFNPGGARNSEFFNWGLQADRIGELRSFIDRHIPTVLGLQGAGTTGNHQVIAFGYNMGHYSGDLGAHREDFQVFVLDPNHPGQQRTLIPDLNRRLYHYKEGGDETWITYFVDKNYHAQNPPVIPNASYPHDNLTYELVLDFHTGGDDLRGGNDNIDVVVEFLDGTREIHSNINLGARWVVDDDESAEVMLHRPVPLEKIHSLLISTTFQGGSGGDNWDMKSLAISALGGGELYQQIATAGLKRFTGDDKLLVVPVHDALPSGGGQKPPPEVCAPPTPILCPCGECGRDGRDCATHVCASRPPPALPGRLQVTPTTLAFVAKASKVPAARKLILYNAGGSALTWSARTDDSHLHLDVGNGVLEADNSAIVTVTVDAQSAVGARDQTIVVDAGKAGKAVTPVKIAVTKPASACDCTAPCAACGPTRPGPCAVCEECRNRCEN